MASVTLPAGEFRGHRRHTGPRHHRATFPQARRNQADYRLPSPLRVGFGGRYTTVARRFDGGDFTGLPAGGKPTALASSAARATALAKAS
ncbi:hypothetical protein CO2235_150091 [Cupriavidus oxalaticus]|uniref:Uncharacterized protein n=1 Tax=Cupriavidus oxalaticus TaxID=96344 RepID=A0A375FPB6_9BURK|nr:hypothetical protein CO2235_U600028 [Cupriavidus oxalaticus]SPC12436.1 hypothetical protein CO2235_150091 [Cupriavidus oxalaticus]